MKFLKQFDKDYGCKSVEYGMDYWIKSDDYRDINTAMVEAFESYKAEIYPRLKQRAKKKKLDQIQALTRQLEELE